MLHSVSPGPTTCMTLPAATSALAPGGMDTQRVRASHPTMNNARNNRRPRFPFVLSTTMSASVWCDVWTESVLDAELRMFDITGHATFHAYPTGSSRSLPLL